jgi:uncharacterized BrkB/YihY/UPF0761 family membrane protein
VAITSVLASIALFGSSALLAVWVAGGPARLLGEVSGTELNPSFSHYLLLLLLTLLGVAFLALFFFVASPRPGVRRRVFPGAVLEQHYLPTTSRVLAAVRRTLDF